MSGNTSQPSLREYTIALEGSSVSCILIGVYLAIFGVNVFLLRKKRSWILLSYSIAQLAITTLYFTVSLYILPTRSIEVFIFYSSALSKWPEVILNIAFVSNTLISDAFLLYRCYVVSLGNRYMLVFPVLLYFATFGWSLAWFIVDSTPWIDYGIYDAPALPNSGIFFWSCSTTMNIFASGFICVRLWMHQKLVSKALGIRRQAFYIRYIAMTLESTLLYTVFVIAVLVVFSLNSPLRFVFTPVLGIVQVIAPSLVINRIARGISFETDGNGSVAMSSIHFASPD